jgi:16S rRNA G966 N2-methylase RsmD
LRNHVKLIAASVGAWLQTVDPDEKFDIVVCDPPYTDLQPSLLQRLSEKVTADGIFVLSWPGDKELLDLAGLQLLERKNYGDITLAFYGNRA